jgi:histidine ammonia-lyase
VDKLSAGESPVYGINTGFGKFAERKIPAQHVGLLQRNLIRSHACGVGEETTRDVVLAMWLLRLKMLAKGHSGVRESTLKEIIRVLEAGVLGCVPSRGSVGASGDLAPSAHAVLSLLGEGDCTRPAPFGSGFERVSARLALRDLGLNPVELQAKEGLALINGTQFTTALACKAWYEACRLLRAANLAAAMTMEAMGGTGSILEESVLGTHHAETQLVGRTMARWLKGSKNMHLARSERRFMQAPYCLRCAPQVHGAVLADLEHAFKILTAEINSLSDNPLVFPETGEVHSCGNFHAIYPARVSDMIASAMATLGTISERRINMAMDESLSGLPYFLVSDGGLNSGLMMVQATAAALASEAKTLSHPASVDSIPTNCDREDHVSMGPVAGLKALQVIARIKPIVAIEFLVAAQALDLRPMNPPPEMLQMAWSRIRQEVPFIDTDTVLSPCIAAIEQMIEADWLPPGAGEADPERGEACRTISFVGLRSACQPGGPRCVASMLESCPACAGLK